MTFHIESSSNWRIIANSRLKKRGQRDASGTFLIEGTRETERAVAADTAIVEIFLCEDYAAAETLTLAEDIARTGIQCTTTSVRAFDKLSMRRHPDGIVAVAPVWNPSLDDLTTDLTLVAESIEKPGNLGAMFRTADATGAGLLIADPNVDPFNPNVVRASQGSLFSVPFAVTDTDSAIDWSRRRGSVFVATPDADVELWDADLAGIAAIVVGSEHGGVSTVWRGIGSPVRIPMAGSADSLNASVSAAVMLFESIRQRR